MRSAPIFEREPAYLLHRRPYQDTAYLVYFLTLTHGWLTAVARFSSRLSDNALQAFVPVFLSCGGHGELLNVRSLEARGVAVLNQADAQVYGLYINELILRLLPARQAFSRIFEFYVETLMQLREPVRREVSVRRFEVEVLKAIGYGLPFISRRRELQIDKQSWYLCNPDSMPVCSRRPADAQLRKSYYHGRTLRALQTGLADDTEEDVLIEAKRFLEHAINRCLGSRKLRSRSLFGYLRKV